MWVISLCATIYDMVMFQTAKCQACGYRIPCSVSSARNPWSAQRFRSFDLVLSGVLFHGLPGLFCLLPTNVTPSSPPNTPSIVSRLLCPFFLGSSIYHHEPIRPPAPLLQDPAHVPVAHHGASRSLLAACIIHREYATRNRCTRQ